MHDATKILMGQTGSSVKEVENRAGVKEAGLGIRLKSDDTLSTTLADGALIGISLGKSLSNTDRTAIVRRGLRVPVKLASGYEPEIGEQLGIDDVTGEADEVGAGVTACNGVFASEILTGVAEDGTEVDCALVDFPGGL